MINTLNTFSLDGKVIIVTGGTGVLGDAFTKAIAEAGGNVGILGRNLKIAEARAEAIRQNGGKAFALRADVMKESELLQAKAYCLDNFGKIDGLVNAAGGNNPASTLQADDDIFRINLEGMKQGMELNLWGTLLPTQVFGEAMAHSAGGAIVNISSMASQRALTKVLGYSMGKAAIDCYTKWFAVELAARYGDKIRMNAIAPGFFLTEQNRFLLTKENGGFTERGDKVIRNTPLKRFGQADELKGALVWLLSDASKFVTGAIVNIDGGFSIFSGV